MIKSDCCYRLLLFWSCGCPVVGQQPLRMRQASRLQRFCYLRGTAWLPGRAATQSAVICRRALLHNLATDEMLMVFPNASGAGAGAISSTPGAAPHAPGGGACTAIAFRTGVQPCAEHSLSGCFVRSCYATVTEWPTSTVSCAQLSRSWSRHASTPAFDYSPTGVCTHCRQAWAPL